MEVLTLPEQQLRGFESWGYLSNRILSNYREKRNNVDIPSPVMGSPVKRNQFMKYIDKLATYIQLSL